MATKFLTYIGQHYEEIQTKLKMLCGRNKQAYDEDGYHEAVIRCYKAIEKKGTMTDPSPYGMESYLIRSYFNYIKEEARSCKIAKRDRNITSDNIDVVYEDWYNSNHNDSRQKIVNDLYNDFSTLYIMHKVEDTFDGEHFYLFRLKTLCEMTYKQLSTSTGIRGCRQKVVEVKRWLQQNLTKEEVNNAFYKMYGDIL